MANIKQSERKDRIKKLKELQKAGINPYPASSERAQTIKEVLDNFKEKNKVAIAGRLMTMRSHGNLIFANLQDGSGKIQIAISKKEIGDKNFKIISKLIDMGDFVQIEGECFITHKGENSVNAKKWKMLSKAIRPLPDKFHGLKDEEEKLRKRYLDLLFNPEVKDIFIMRAKILKLIREFLDKDGFLEVETPVLQVLYGGTNAKPFITHINTYDMQMYLRVAPELYLKRVLIGGVDKVYEIARNFRNEGADQTHNPEFTMIEWYEAYGDYNTVIDRIEELCKFIARELFGKEEIKYKGKKMDISKKWLRLTMVEAIKKYLKIDIDKMDDKEIEKLLNKHKIEIRGEKNKGQMVFAIFDKLVCDYLIEPTWIIDYPKEVSPLAKKHRNNDKLVERYELYIGGKEISDGWTEINDPIDQRDRFEKEQAAMRAGNNDEAHPLDEDFIEAMEYGMPPTGGMGMGIDRLVMLFADHWSIRDVILFPIMKPKNTEQKTESIEQNSKDMDLGISYEDAKKLITKFTKEEVNNFHYIETEAIMRALAKHFGEDEEKWGIIGLLHDIDWELTADKTEEHCLKCVEILKEAGATDFLIKTIQSHAYGAGWDKEKYYGPEELRTKERSGRLQHALAAAETITGLIIATTKVNPDKKLASVKVSSLKKKFKNKKFAANCNRNIIKEIEETGMSLDEFFELSLKALQGISDKLGL